MGIKLETTGDSITVLIGIKRIDGSNSIYNHIVNANEIEKDVEKVIFDMDKVEYVNSLGIAEFISIHRYFSNINQGRTSFTFINLDQKIYAILEMVEIGKLADLITK